MQLLSISLREVVWLICKVTEVDPRAKKMQRERIINNLYLRVNFTLHFSMPKVVINFYDLNFEAEGIKVNESA